MTINRQKLAWELEENELFISLERWETVPIKELYERAMESHLEGVPTAIGYREDLGYYMLWSAGQGPVLDWVEIEDSDQEERYPALVVKKEKVLKKHGKSFQDFEQKARRYMKTENNPRELECIQQELYEIYLSGALSGGMDSEVFQEALEHFEED